MCAFLREKAHSFGDEVEGPEARVRSWRLADWATLDTPFPYAIIRLIHRATQTGPRRRGPVAIFTRRRAVVGIPTATYSSACWRCRMKGTFHQSGSRMTMAGIDHDGDF
jgi:hypothetical protein